MNGAWLALGTVALGAAATLARGSRARTARDRAILPSSASAEAFRAPDVARHDTWIWWGLDDDPRNAESFTLVEKTWRGYRVTRFDALESPPPPARMKAITGAWRVQTPEGAWVAEKDAPPPPENWTSISTTVEETDLAPGRRLGPRVAAGIGSEILGECGGHEDMGTQDMLPEISEAERQSAMRRMTALRARMDTRRRLR